jgi:hypothetical protein
VADQTNRDHWIRAIVQSLAGYIERRSALTVEVERQEVIVASAPADSYEYERAVSECRVLRTKLALYDAEIALLYSHLRRYAAQDRTSGVSEAIPRHRRLPPLDLFAASSAVG